MSATKLNRQDCLWSLRKTVTISGTQLLIHDASIQKALKTEGFPIAHLAAKHNLNWPEAIYNLVYLPFVRIFIHFNAEIFIYLIMECCLEQPQRQFIIYSSGPQPFWHQGQVSWKTIFPRTGKEGDGFGMIQAHYISCALYYLTGGTGPWTRGWGPLIIEHMHHKFSETKKYTIEGVS